MRLKELREELGMTQAQVAAELGCNKASYNRYESGVREPSLETLTKIADLFGVTLDYLVGKDDGRNNVLSSYEQELLAASRSADVRARRDAIELLKRHQQE